MSSIQIAKRDKEGPERVKDGTSSPKLARTKRQMLGHPMANHIPKTRQDPGGQGAWERFEFAFEATPRMLPT